MNERSKTLYELSIFYIEVLLDSIYKNFHCRNWYKSTCNGQNIKLKVFLTSRIDEYFLSFLTDSKNGGITLKNNKKMMFVIGVVLNQ